MPERERVRFAMSQYNMKGFGRARRFRASLSSFVSAARNASPHLKVRRARPVFGWGEQAAPAGINAFGPIELNPTQRGMWQHAVTGVINLGV